MCSIDVDPPEFFNSKTVTARKSHKCDECARDILDGEVYTNAIGKWDGTFSAFKTCSHCTVLQKWLRRECGGFLYGGLSDEMEEHAREYQSFWLWRGLASMRKKWRTKDGQMMRVFSLENSPQIGAQ